MFPIITKGSLLITRHIRLGAILKDKIYSTKFLESMLYSAFIDTTSSWYGALNILNFFEQSQQCFVLVWTDIRKLVRTASSTSRWGSEKIGKLFRLSEKKKKKNGAFLKSQKICYTIDNHSTVLSKCLIQ